MRYTLILLVAFIPLVGLAGGKDDDSKYTADRYIEKYKKTAQKQGNHYNIPPSILLAQGLIASDSGRNEYCQSANNHFKTACGNSWHGRTYYSKNGGVNQCYKRYNNASNSYDDQAQLLSGDRRFKKLLQLEPTDYKGWAKGLRDSAYNGNSRYDKQLIGTIEKFKLNELD